MKLNTHKKAFSLLELIFVIVILGVVSSIGSSIIVQVYENYITQRAMHNVSVKTELAINQIVNRLTYRIDSTVIARDPNGANNFLPLSALGYDVTNKDKFILEWIGYDEESFSSGTKPNWSGHTDIDTTTRTNIRTPGSHLTKVRTIVQNLAGNTNEPSLSLFFSLKRQPFSTDIINTGPACYGYDDANMTCIHQVSISDNRNFTATMPSGVNISDHYKLAWSAYALVAVDRSGAVLTSLSDAVDFDLELRYNYQPWAGRQYNDTTTSKKILLRNVTAFKFSERGGTLRLKLCATEKLDGIKTNISICKEKVVIR
jgi:prepilin-type N-terminal cleavage/methylation domain-containing protein